MQAADGLSLDAQRAAIKSYCESVGLHGKGAVWGKPEGGDRKQPWEWLPLWKSPYGGKALVTPNSPKSS